MIHMMPAEADAELQVVPSDAEASLLMPSGQTHDKLPSIGSKQHGTGECRPCVWFHKPQGCGNGEQCLHCHLCEESEIRRRRAKASVLKRQSSNLQRAWQRGVE